MREEVNNCRNIEPALERTDMGIIRDQLLIWDNRKHNSQNPTSAIGARALVEADAHVRDDLSVTAHTVAWSLRYPGINGGAADI